MSMISFNQNNSQHSTNSISQLVNVEENSLIKQSKCPGAFGTEAKITGLMRLQNALGILSFPYQEQLEPKNREYLAKKSHSKDEATLLGQKQALMARCLSEDNPQDFVRFDRTVPLFHAGMEQLRENYARWKNQPADVQLQDRIQTQHANLAALAKQLKSVPEKDENLLSQLTASNSSILCDDSDYPIVTGHSFYLSNPDYFSGKKLLSPVELKTDLRDQIERIRNACPDLTKSKRRPFPISKKAIELQARVFEAESQALKWANAEGETLQDLSSYCDVHNDVFEFRYTVALQSLANTHRVTAFFKFGDDESRIILDHMMWEIAVILGREDDFVPNKFSVIYEDDENCPRGIIQPYQEGRLLADVLSSAAEGNVAIDRKSLISGVLTALTFGMFGKRNIILDSTGKPKFIENALSMPHSNHLLDMGDEFVSPFSCDLLEMQESSQPLSLDEIEQLTAELATIESKMGLLEKYFKSKQTKALMAQLSPGWLYLDDALIAMRERMVALRKTLTNPKKNLTLKDLALDAIPGYKLWTALRIVYMENFDPEKIADGIRSYRQDCGQDDDNFSVDHDELRKEFNDFTLDPWLHAGLYKIDFTSILPFINNQSGSLEDIVEQIRQAQRDNAAATSPQETKIHSRVVAKLAVDFKGKPYQLIRTSLYDYVARVLDTIDSNFRIGQYRTVDVKTLSDLEKGKFMFVRKENYKDPISPEIFLLLKQKSGATQVANVDYYFIPGKFVIKTIQGVPTKINPMTWWELQEFILKSAANEFTIRSVDEWNPFSIRQTGHWKRKES